jgi:tyrosine-protein kinase Etk/Wzc
MSELELEEENESKPVTNSFDIQRATRKLFRNFHWILLCAALGWVCAKVWFRYQVPVFKVSASLLVNSEEATGTKAVLKQAGLLDETENLVDNEVFILRSFSLIGKVVDSMNLQINVTTNGRIKEPPVYLETLPVYFISKRKSPSKETPTYLLQFNKGSYSLTHGKEKYKSAYNAPLYLNGGDTLILVLTNPAAIDVNKEYNLQILPRNTVVSRYQDRLLVKASKTGKGMIEMTLEDEFPDRAEKFLSILIHVYNEEGIKYKNQAIRNALEFLNNRIAALSSELEQQGTKTRNIKVQSNVMDVSASASAILTQMQGFDEKQKENQYNETLLGLVENYVKNYNGKEEIVPNTSGLSDPVLGAMVQEYNKLVLVKRDLLDRGTPNDPHLAGVDGQLEQLRNNILKNTQNIKTQFSSNQNYLSGLSNEYKSKFQQLPDREKQFVQIARQTGIKETLYVFLLQKKEDVAVQLVSSDVYNSRLVDEPRNQGMIAPDAKSIYMMGLGLGLILPIGFILLSVFLNKKILSRRDVEINSPVPIVAEVMETPEDDTLNTMGETRSIIAEQFRLLRTNLAYMGNDVKVILVTSFVRNEGKSFTSLNLVNIFAQTGKKAVILEFDLRKPKLLKRLNIAGDKGISDFIVTDIPEKNIIKTVKVKNSSFDVIGCGNIPPNPAELILNPRVDRLFNYLRKNYDYIIVDTAPVGLVADTFSLARIADATLYIVRHDVTEKTTLNFINKVKADNKLPHLAIVINGIKSKHGFGYSYGYGYGYGYGYASELAR